MLGAQQRIPIVVEFRRAQVKLASPAPEQVVVYCVPDQHMCEQEHLAARLLRPQEKPRDQSLRNIIRLVEQVGQRSMREPLAENRSGLNGRLIPWIEPIDARLHQALYRAGHGYCLAFVCMAKQLIEEKRIASSALDAALSERGVRYEKRLRESACVVWRHRT